MEVVFTINGKPYHVNASTVPVDTSLNTYIRTHANLRGTKFMCLEGGCGACIVTVKGINPVTKEPATWAINSCLVNVFSCHGLDIITVEGLGDKKKGYHDIQARLAQQNGSQCGYCSPGMVMNMYSLLESKNGEVTMKEIENSFGGNICRCTGYRPILDAFKSIATDADPKYANICKDIEDFTKICPKTGTQCAGTCSAIPDRKKPVSLVFDDKREWHKPANLKEVISIFKSIGSKPYMLVAGNTAHGVYRRAENLEIFIDITGIEELHSYTIDKTVEIGASVSLTETMNILSQAALKNPKFLYCKHLVDHIDLIANVPVRNVGSIAGNLSIKHQNKEFPSDMFLILEAAGAKLTIVDVEGKSVTVTPAEYLQTDMKKKILTRVTLPPLPVERFTFRSYKIMPRAQNAHAYVNAGFLFEFNEKKDKVITARICFGGIDPKFIHATQSEQFILNKNLYDDKTVQELFKVLESEIQPDWVLPDASPQYRKNLAASLFYKFILGTCPTQDKIKSTYKSGGDVYDRPLSSGTQVYDTYEKNYPLTKNVPKIEGIIQSSGEAEYCNDIPKQPNELWGAFVLASEAQAKIVGIDATDALKIPGVAAFFSAKDIPGKNTFLSTRMMLIFQDEEIFCSGDVLYHGQPVGVIVADTFELANAAAKKVVIKYEKKNQQIVPTIFDAIAMKAKDRYFDQPFGYAAKELGTNSVHTVSGHFEIGAQYHFTMETQSCVCIPTDEGLNVYSATQWIDGVQIAMSEALNIPENMLNFSVKRLGGGYGGKISRAGLIACACALASHLLNRPVRLVLSLESNMSAIGKRYACVSDYVVETDENGKIQKLKNDYAQDYGCTLNEPVEFSTSEFFKNCYNNSSWEVVGKAVKTDAPSHTWCRAPGTTEGIAMIENIMEHIAKKLGMDPIAVRLANIDEGNILHTMVPDFLKSIEFEKRKGEIEAFNNQNRWKKRGIAVLPMQYPLGYFGSIHVLISIFHGDGTVAITHGGIEMGQGINTKVVQIAAHILGIPMDKISVKQTTSLTAPNDIVTGGSMTSEAVGYGVKRACEILVERIQPVREELKDADWATICHKCYEKNIDLNTTFLYKATDLTPYLIYGCSATECEIDLLTGNIQLLRVDILEDTGESMSPGIDVGQIEGSFVMGVGYYLTENLVYNRENGELLTNRTWTYKPPGAKDIPIDFRITLLQKSSNPLGVLRSKATGEPAVCMSIVVLFALRNAIDAARKDAGLPVEWYPLGAPSTPEHIYLATGSSIEQFKLSQ